MDLKAKIWVKEFSDDICQSAHDVVRSNIWKRILQILLEKRIHEDLEWLVDVEHLIEKIFSEDQKLDIDEAVYLFELLEINSAYKRYEWHHFMWIGRAAFSIFERLLIHGAHKHDLKEKIYKLWWSGFENFKSELEKIIYQKFINFPEEFKILTEWKQVNIVGWNVVYWNWDNFTVYQWVPYEKHNFQTSYDSEIYISEQLNSSLIVLDSWTDTEKNIIIPQNTLYLVDRTKSHLVLKTANHGKYLLYNFEKEEVVFEDIENISDISENTILLFDWDRHIVYDLQDWIVTKSFSIHDFKISDIIKWSEFKNVAINEWSEIKWLMNEERSWNQIIFSKSWNKLMVKVELFLNYTWKNIIWLSKEKWTSLYIYFDIWSAK